MRRIAQVIGELLQSFAEVWRQQQGLGKVIVGLVIIALLSGPSALVSLVRLGKETLIGGQPPPSAASSALLTEKAAVAPTPTRAPVPTFTPLPSPSLEPSPVPSATAVGMWAQVLNVIDGDTIVVLQDGQQRVVSYLGIEAPRFGEGGQPDEGLASEARVANTVLVQGKVVRMEGKESWVNERGHLLCYVWLGDEMVNAALVRLGYARCDASLVGSPHLDTLARLEQEARQRQAGMWAQTQQLMAMASQPMTSPSGEPTAAEAETAPAGTALADTTPVPESVSAGPTVADAPTTAFLVMNLAPSPDAPTLSPSETEAVPPSQTPLPPVTLQPAPTEPPPPTQPPTLPPTPAPPPTAPPQAATGGVQITKVFADGEKGRAEPDEYCEIRNSGSSEVNLQGWRLNAGANGQDYIFPAVALAPGHSCRVYTNEQHAESGGFSFDSGSALWKNGGDCGYLYDAGGQQVHAYCY